MPLPVVMLLRAVAVFGFVRMPEPGMRMYNRTAHLQISGLLFVSCLYIYIGYFFPCG